MKCKKCNNNCEGEYCFQHKPRKPMSKGLFSQMRSRPATDLKRTNEKIDKEAMKYFFLDLWKTRPHKSEVSGQYLGKEPLSIYFHHILPKEKYPEACLDAENIILLTLIEHSNVESDMYKYEEVNKRRKQLILKYEGT